MSAGWKCLSKHLLLIKEMQNNWGGEVTLKFYVSPDFDPYNASFLTGSFSDNFFIIVLGIINGKS